MEYLVGFVIAVVVAGLGSGVGFDRERSFASTILIVVAAYFVLFALMGGSSRALVLETAVASGFLLMAVVGFRKYHWLLPAGIVGHGVFDFFHHWLIENPGVPPWWPGFCMTFDVLFGAWLFWLLARRSQHYGRHDARP